MLHKVSQRLPVPLSAGVGAPTAVRTAVAAHAQQQQHRHGVHTGATHGPSRMLQASLDTMLASYYGRTPSAASVLDKVYAQGYGLDQVVHDHFAFRTYGVPGLGIESLGAALEGFGYTRRDFYTFPKTHLLAAWYAPPRELYGVLPRMFVSQLQANKLSPRAQAIIHSYADDALAAATAAASSGAVTAAGAGSDASRASGSGGSAMGPALSAWTAALTQALPWRTPSREDYLALLDESEYGAWVLVNGYALNHTALSVHSIAGRSGDIYAFADELVAKGFRMNEAGGIMKVSPDSGLLQCATVADVVPFTFADGETHSVVGAYMEFVERKVQGAALNGAHVPETVRRDGFEADSATNIFASTALAAAQVQQQQQ